MSRASASCVVLCLALVGQADDEPKKPRAEKWIQITKDKLLGEWKGEAGSPLSLKFTDKKVAVTVIVKEAGATKTTTLDWDYEINAKGETVNLHPLPLDIEGGAGLGNAGLKSDGTLVVSIVAVPPAIPKTIEGVVLKRVRPDNPKK